MTINLPQTEQDVLKFWQTNNIFEKQQAKNKDAETFVFYDGPPFATGTPHHGHLTASTIKDVIETLKKGRDKDKTSSIVVVAEGDEQGNAQEIASKVSPEFPESS